MIHSHTYHSLISDEEYEFRENISVIVRVQVRLQVQVVNCTWGIFVRSLPSRLAEL